MAVFMADDAKASVVVRFAKFGKGAIAVNQVLTVMAYGMSLTLYVLAEPPLVRPDRFVVATEPAV